MNLPIAIKENWVSFATYMFLNSGLNFLYVSLFKIYRLIWPVDRTKWKAAE